MAPATRRRPAGRAHGRGVAADARPALLDLLPDEADGLAAPRRGHGRLGRGRACAAPSGADRFTDAAAWWRAVARAAVVRDEVAGARHRPGLLRQLRLRRRPRRQRARRAAGRRRHPRRRCWVTAIGDEPPRCRPRATSPARPAPRNLAFADGALSGAAWESVVADAVRRINAGELEKVVLARDLVATADAADRRPLAAARLAADYAMCWTFHVDGLFGATPELLVRRERGLVTSRVLAGTIRRTGDDEHDAGAGRRAGAVLEGPRGARVCGPLGRRRRWRRTAPR